MHLKIFSISSMNEDVNYFSSISIRHPNITFLDSCLHLPLCFLISVCHVSIHLHILFRVQWIALGCMEWQWVIVLGDHFHWNVFSKQLCVRLLTSTQWYLPNICTHNILFSTKVWDHIINQAKCAQFRKQKLLVWEGYGMIASQKNQKK